MAKTDAAEKTASYRAIENLNSAETRLINDPYSIYFLSGRNLKFVKSMQNKYIYRWLMSLVEKIVPGVYGAIIMRGRYMDDVITEVVDRGFDTVVGLGGGFDSRPLRLKAMEKVTYYHVDLPEVVTAYEGILRKIDGSILDRVRFVPIDFNRQSLSDALDISGYEPDRKTVFAWEGVTQYITRDAMEATLTYVAGTRPGNKIGFSYVLKEFLDKPSLYPGYEKFPELVKKQGFPWINGLSRKNLNIYLNELGFILVEDLGSEDYQERYLRTIGRDLAVIELERVALAVVR